MPAIAIETVDLDAARETNIELVEELTTNYTNYLHLVWNNRWGLSPQEVFDALGPKASNLLTIAFAIHTMLVDIVPDTLPVDPFERGLLVKDDGTVKVGKG